MSQFFSWLLQSMILSPVAIWFAWMFGVEHEDNKVERGAGVKNENKFTENDSEGEEKENVADTKEEETQSNPEPESSVLAAGAKLRPDAPEFIPSPPLSPASHSC